MNHSAIRRMRFIQGVIWALLLLAAVVSASHIVDTADTLGVPGLYRFAAVALIDFVAIVGKLSMYEDFIPAFRKSGFRLLMTGGVLSLAANVYAGDTIGEKGFGALTVAAFMLLEHHATKAGKAAVAPTPASRKLAPEVAAERAEKAQATREARKLERAASAEAIRWAGLTPAQRGAETRARRATAPVSPAPAGKQA